MFTPPVNIKEKYQLFLKWDSIERVNSLITNINNARFCGPALKIARKIQSDNDITLDLTPHYLNAIKNVKGLNYYWCRFFWREVKYFDNIAYLGNTRFESSFISNDIRLNNTDYFIIDTEKHEEKIHVYNLVYNTVILNREGKIYNYR